MAGLLEHAAGRVADTTLEGRGLGVRLGPGAEAPLLFEGVHLTLRPGEVVDLVGPSGSGKTTLLRVLARLHPFGFGELFLDGAPASDLTPQHWRTHVVLLPQKAAFIPGTVADNLLMAFGFATRAGVQRPDGAAQRRLLDAVGLADIELDHDVARLSVGQAARVALCRTLLTGPDVLLLDEADAALDPESVERISALVATYVGEGLHTCLRVRHRESDGHTTRRLVFAQGVLAEEALDE